MDNPRLQIQSDGKVFLNLPTVKYNKRRFIGTIDYSKNTFISVPRYKKYHLFKNTNSLSVPYDLIYKRKKGFIYVSVKLDGKDLYTSALALKKLGIVMQFLKQGFEKQIFLELNKFKRTKREARIERLILKKGKQK
jgi:hypothetical protein